MNDGHKYELKWDQTPDGNVIEAASALHDDGSPFYWRIRDIDPHEIGRHFAVGDSDRELIDEVDADRIFMSQGLAKRWCESNEKGATG